MLVCNSAPKLRCINYSCWALLGEPGYRGYSGSTVGRGLRWILNYAGNDDKPSVEKWFASTGSGNDLQLVTPLTQWGMRIFSVS